MEYQVNMLNSLGLKAAFVSCDQDFSTIQEIEAGRFMFVFISPEAALEKFRYLFETTVRKDNLIGVEVDKLHCVTQWEASGSNKKRLAFRVWYSQVNQIRSMVDDILFTALTATVTKHTKHRIFELLELEKPTEIAASPDKSNIHYSVQWPL